MAVADIQLLQPIKSGRDLFERLISHTRARTSEYHGLEGRAVSSGDKNIDGRLGQPQAIGEIYGDQSALGRGQPFHRVDPR